MPVFANDPTLVGVLDPNAVLTIYNLNSAKRSVFNTAQVDRNAPDDKSIYNGIETSFAGRLPRGAVVFGGWTVERNVSVFCTNDDNPNGPATTDYYNGESVSLGGVFCDQRQFNLKFRNEFKLSGNYPLWRGFEIAAVLQSYPGVARTITYTPAANLFPGGRTNSESLILNKPGSLFQPRYNQLDLNFKKLFRAGRKTYSAQFDMFNALNGNAIFTTNNTIGASLGQVNTILQGRIVRLAFQMKF